MVRAVEPLSRFKFILPLLSLLALFLFVSSGASHAQEAAPAEPAVSVEQLQDLAATLEDPEARERLLGQIRSLIEVQEQPSDPGQVVDTVGARALALLSDRVAVLSNQFVALARAFSDIPQAVVWFERQLTNPVLRDRWVDLATQLVIVVGLGFVASRIVRFAIGRPYAALGSRGAATRLGRLPYLSARLLLDVIVIVAFAVAGYAALSVTDPPEAIRLAALAIINATIIINVTLALARFVLSPGAPGLRPIAVDDETAHYLFIWVRRITYTAVYGFFIAEAALLLGLPTPSYRAFLKVVGLVVAMMVIVLILQNRTSVRDRLRGRTRPSDDAAAGVSGRSLGVARRRLAEVWHVLAILYVAVTFAIFALNIRDGFAFILAATVQTVLILVVGRLLIGGIDRVIHRGFAVPDDLRRQFPKLETRANSYLPILQRVLKLVVLVVAFLALLNAWGIESFAWLDTAAGRNVLSSALSVAFVLLIAVIAWELVSNLIERYLTGEGQDGAVVERSARVRTLLPLLRNAFLVVLVALVTLIVLSEIGVNIAPLLAGAGVIGLAVGFGSQTLVKDVITGLFILFEDTISVGDVVNVGGHSGAVESISIRTIRLRDLSGTVHTVPFSDVTSILNLTKDFSFCVLNVGVAYREDVDHVIQVLREIGEELMAVPEYGAVILEPIDVLGVDAFADSAVIIKARIKTLPIKQWFVGREFNRRMKKRFDELGIEIPFPHLTLYFGEDKQGKAPPGHLIVQAPEMTEALAAERARRLADASGEDRNGFRTPDRVGDGPATTALGTDGVKS